MLKAVGDNRATTPMFGCAEIFSLRLLSLLPLNVSLIQSLRLWARCQQCRNVTQVVCRVTSTGALVGTVIPGLTSFSVLILSPAGCGDFQNSRSPPAPSTNLTQVFQPTVLGAIPAMTRVFCVSQLSVAVTKFPR